MNFDDDDELFPAPPPLCGEAVRVDGQPVGCTLPIGHEDEHRFPAPTPTLERRVAFDLDLSTVIGRDYEGAPITLGDRVAEIVAGRVVERAGRDWYPRVRIEAGEIAEKLVEERFRDVLEREIVPTDGFGTPRGEPTTLAQMIDERAEKWLSARRDGSGRGAGSSNLQALIDEAVGRAFQNEVKKTVEAAKSEALKAISESAAQTFAEIIQRAAGTIR